MNITTKLERRQLQQKHSFNGWTSFTPVKRETEQQRQVSYRTKERDARKGISLKLQERDNLKLEREGWK